MKRRSLVVIGLGIILLVGGGVYVYRGRFAPTTDTSSTPPTSFEISPPPIPTVRSVIATGLDTPWTIVFLPSGEMLVSERKGTIQRIGTTRHTLEIPGVVEVGESGLTGMVLHPQFSSNQFLYVYFTTKSGGKNVNRVVRYRFDGETISDPVTIVDDIPAGTNHNGGQIAFGPDGKLYICTGDVGTSSLAQEKNSLAGKILRVNDDGSIPSDNPFGNAIYSYGHRNPQGITWDDQGRLWATEHGRSGLSTGYDELNLIESGQNYGWPTIQGSATRAGMRSPVSHSGSKTTWAPAGIVYRNGSVYFVGLRGQSLYQAVLLPSGEVETIKAHFREEYGRLRAIALGPDGAIYFSTSNKDGRGAPKAGDDQIIRWMP